MPELKAIPVILDTDIGDDIDDTWALAMLLKSPEVDLRMVVTDYGNTKYRAALTAKFLERAGRTDIPIGVGIVENDQIGRQGPWVGDYDLEAYPGAVEQDGVGAMIDLIMRSDEQVTLLCIGPCPNVAAALEREPKIAERARFVGMYGSVFGGYGGRETPDAEWNVRANPAAVRAAFTASWEKTITPVDTCGIVRLTGGEYAKVREHGDEVTTALMENYDVWAEGHGVDSAVESSVLFDTVAVYLTYSSELLEIERIGLSVTDDGFTVPDADGPEVDVAVRWKDLKQFERYLTERLTG
jgi:inosine-uridine nucleoside N-ribohydrolase